MLPSMLWSIFLLASTGLLYFDANQVDAGFSMVKFKGLTASNSKLAAWINTHKLPGSFDDPSFELFAAAALRGSSNVKARSQSGQAVCSKFVQDEILSLNNRRLGYAPNVAGGIVELIYNGLNMLFECLLGGPDPSSGGDVATPTLLTPSQLLERQISRGIRSILIEDIPKFPEDDIHDAMILSHLSYRTEVEVHVDASIDYLRKDQVEGFPMYIPGEEEYDTQAYVWLSKTSRKLTIAFRGTQTVTDMIHDMDYRTVALGPSYPNVLVHTGFKGKVFSILMDINEILSDNADAYDTIVYTGHSLGGALATLTAAIVANERPQKRHECLSFGSPRVGNEGFVNWFGAVVNYNIRLTNDKDPIAILPFEEVYQHVSAAITMSEDLQLTFVPEVPSEKRFLYAIEDFVSIERMLEEHHLLTYIDRLAALFKKLN